MTFIKQQLALALVGGIRESATLFSSRMLSSRPVMPYPAVDVAFEEWAADPRRQSYWRTHSTMNYKCTGSGPTRKCICHIWIS